MALIDSSIYQNAPKSVFYGVNQALDGIQQDRMADLQRQGLMAQRQREEEQRIRDQSFQKNLSGLLGSYGEYASTPEGQRDIFQKMSKAGYAKEMIGVMGGIPQIQPPAKGSYEFQDTPGGWMAGNKETGEMKANAAVPSAKHQEKQAEDKFISMKGTLDKIMTPPPTGWDPLKGEKANALSRAIAYMPADVLKSKVAQDWISNNKAEQQNTVFNPAAGDIAGSRKLSIYVSKFDHAQDLYEKKATPLQNLIGTMNSPTWGTAAGDVSLINQLSLAEFGGYKPSEAEYKAFGKGFTPAQYAQKWLSLAQTGNTLPEQVRNNMVKEVEEVSRKTHENFKRTMEEQAKRVKSAGVDPADVIYPGGVFQDLEGYFSKKAPASPSAPATPGQPSNVSPAMLDLAKKALADPSASPAHKAAARKILGQ